MLKKYLGFFYIVISVLFFHQISYGIEDDWEESLIDPLKQGPIWTIGLSGEPASPEQPPLGSGWEIQLPDSPLHSSALKFYPLSPYQTLSDNEKATTWDRLGTFGQAIDTTIFSSNQSRAMAAFALLGAGAGLMVSSPSCGYLMYNIADFLGVPLSGAVTNFLICWISITTAPAFTTLLHEKAEEVGSHISQLFKRTGFTPTGRKSDSRPHVIKKNWSHEILDLMAFFSASISAGTLTALLNVAENEYFVFFNITALPFYFLWQAIYFCEISSSLNQFFQKYFYLPEGTKYKKRILQEKIAHFKSAIGHQDYARLADETFKDIEGARKKGFPTNSGEPFVFSGLFLKASHRADPTISRNGAASLLNFRMDMESLRPSWKEDMLGWFSIFALGIATYQKFFITQHILNDPILSVAQSLSLAGSHEGAYIGSTILSGYETFFKMFALASSQKKFFIGLKEVCSVNHVNTCQWARKIAGLLCGANACLFSLPVMVAGLDLYHDDSTLSKMAYVLPVFLIDFSFYNQLLNSATNKSITYLLRACKDVRWERLAKLGRRADVSHYADEASAFISDDADEETLEKIYNLLQEGT
ncbi:MAG: hypothetical protein K0R76_997 [Alphaproteobacteria bacterium]|jgi:hypothetical protein|nr:hypothetical protein [Alphaproteobacteria bacterium]